MILRMRELVHGSVLTRDTFLDVRELLLNHLGPLVPIIITIETVYRETRYRPSSLRMSREEWTSIATSEGYLSVVKYTGALDADPEKPETLASILNLRSVVVEEKEEKP